MPNWDRYCTVCGFLGSYLDFPLIDPNEVECVRLDPDNQKCDRTEECGATVEYEEDDDDARAEGYDDAAPFDTTSSASRQHYIDTGRYLRKAKGPVCR